MNNTKPARTVRLTSAAYALLATLALAIGTAVAYNVNQPMVYLIGLTATVLFMFITGDLSSKYGKWASKK